MSVYPSRLSVVCATLLAFSLVAGSHMASAMVLDWDAATWNPGSLNNSYDLNGDAVNDVTVKITSQQANIWAIDPTSGTQTPTVNQTLTGGLSPVENSLMLAANLKTNSNVTLQLSFTGGPGGLPGANNVSFTIFDIDVTTNSDIIDNIYGVAPNGTHVAPTITNAGPAVIVSGSGLSYTLTGNAASPDNSSNGNVTISFGSTLIYDVFLDFSNTAGAPRYQDIAIGDVSFTPVPEINPAISASVSCLVAVALTVFMQRRAKLRRASR